MKINKCRTECLQIKTFDQLVVAQFRYYLQMTFNMTGDYILICVMSCGMGLPQVRVHGSLRS